METNILFTAARSYAEAGLSVIPINVSNKRPLVPWQNYQAQIADPDTVTTWFASGITNVGIVCGDVSGGLMVLDFDTNAEEVYAQWRAAIDKRVTNLPTVKTGRGYHVYFRCAAPGRNTKLAFDTEGNVLIETRAEGGYVLAPPSIHSNGNTYHVINGALTDIPFLGPTQVAVVLAAAKALNQREEQHAATRQDQPVDGDVQLTDVVANRDLHPYVRAALEGELSKVVTAKQGTRNDTLNKAAFNLGGFVGSGYLEREDVEKMLHGVAVARGLADHEIRTTIRSGIEAGMKQPRAIPDGSAADASINTTDLGNARRLVQRFGQQMRFVPAWGCWFVWNDRQWVKDTTGMVARFAQQIVGAMHHEAEQAPTDEQRKALQRWAHTSESKQRLEAMIDLAKTQPGISVAHTEFDQDHLLLNVRNGTIDLRTGELRPHQREDLLTKMIDNDYNPAATAPTWEGFLHRAMDGDDALIQFIQRAVGYSLTGDTGEQCLFYAYGTGANGKSTFFEVVQELLGPYAQKTRAEMLMAKPNGGGIPNDIARLVGARFVVTSEVEEGRWLAEATVKDLTGGDTIIARFLHQEFFEFRPTHKIWMYGNYMLLIKGNDPGIWRRIYVIPFAVTIPAHERDPHLKRKLMAEREGILAWAVRGCLAWQQGGLAAPEQVRRATDAYRSQMDVIGAFLNECCELGDNKRVGATDLYRVYKAWCEENGEAYGSQQRFGTKLSERGFGKKNGSNGNTWRTGLALRNKEGQPVAALTMVNVTK